MKNKNNCTIITPLGCRVATLILFSLSALLTIDTFGQSEYDEVRYEQITISGVGLGSRSNSLLIKIGKPDSTYYADNEMEDRKVDIYVYSKSSFFISNKLVDGFKVLDSNLCFDYGHLRVGDSSKKLDALFPVSFKNKYATRGEREVVRVRIGHSDDYVLFTISEGKIDEIATWRDQ